MTAYSKGQYADPKLVAGAVVLRMVHGSRADRVASNHCVPGMSGTGMSRMRIKVMHRFHCPVGASVGKQPWVTPVRMAATLCGQSQGDFLQTWPPGAWQSCRALLILLELFGT